jgi:hypothetical protein
MWAAWYAAMVLVPNCVCGFAVTTTAEGFFASAFMRADWSVAGLAESKLSSEYCHFKAMAASWTPTPMRSVAASPLLTYTTDFPLGAGLGSGVFWLIEVGLASRAFTSLLALLGAAGGTLDPPDELEHAASATAAVPTSATAANREPARLRRGLSIPVLLPH